MIGIIYIVVSNLLHSSYARCIVLLLSSSSFFSSALLENKMFMHVSDSKRKVLFMIMSVTEEDVNGMRDRK